jgi:hypothetical protein
MYLRVQPRLSIGCRTANGARRGLALKPGSAPARRRSKEGANSHGMVYFLSAGVVYFYSALDR